MSRKERQQRNRRDRRAGREWERSQRSLAEGDVVDVAVPRVRPQRPARFTDADAPAARPGRQPRSQPPAPIRATAPSRTSREDLVGFAAGAERVRTALTCGACRNWMPHPEPGGRGTCEHPGSGFAYPFMDTPACPFYDGKGSR